MPQYFNKRKIPKPAGYRSRYEPDTAFLDNYSIVDSQSNETYEWAAPEIPNHREYFGSNCPQITISDNPMWDLKTICHGATGEDDGSNGGSEV